MGQGRGFRGAAIAVALGAACQTEKPTGVGEETGSAESGIAIDGSSDGTSAAVTSGDGPRLDIGGGGSTGSPGDCQGGMMMGENTFSIIWIANTPEGTVSKIDTKTRVELARYYTGPTNGGDDPSRTSVNLQGDAAVSNRGGGITKFASEEVRCVDRDNSGTIETSTGPNDVRPFGADECMIWHIETPVDGDNRHGPRPTAWDAGADDDPCNISDDRLWIGWWDYPNDIGHFERLDGETGVRLDLVEVLDWDTQGQANFGPYGGAVNAEGDLFASGRGPGPLVRIDGETLIYDRWDVPEGTSPYGIAVDAEGGVWMGDWNGGVLHFDPATEAFDVIDTPGSTRARGIMIDSAGFAWAAGNAPCGAIKVDTATLAVVADDIALPGCVNPVGVSIDIDGFVWIPDRDANRAYKLDPNTFASETFEGLVGPYTYSDMTGAGLGLVINPPTG